MQLYELYLVMFEAMARPKVFTPSLFQHLIRLGAPLSRALLQLLYVLHNPLSKDELTRWSEHIEWGNITFSSYAAVMEHGAALVSLGEVSLDMEHGRTA